MSDNTSPLPQLQLQDAMKLALNYLNDIQIGIENHRLASAKWDVDSDTGQWSWYFSWMTANELRKHHSTIEQVTAKLVVNVSDKGKVSLRGS